jgi:hypothetical protein
MHSSTKTALTAILRTDPSITHEVRAAVLAALDGKAAPAASTPAVPRLLRRGEVAKRMAVTVRAVDLWTRSGILQKVTLPGHRRASGFREQDVIALISGKAEASHV